MATTSIPSTDHTGRSGPTAARRLAVGLLGAATVAAGLALTPATAEASKIVYICAPNLCVADPESGASSQITTDGATVAYQHPSITRDGTRIAAVRGDDVVVGNYGADLTEVAAGSRDINDAAIAPDGSGVGESHSYVENVFQCNPFGCGLELVDRSETAYTRVGAPPEDSTRDYDGGGGVGFLGNGALLSSYYTLDTDSNTICVVADPFAVDAPCQSRVTDTATLSSPTGSPDGTLIALAVGDAGSTGATSVNLYDAATGAPVRKLADSAGSPAFSPDGKQLAYDSSDGWIYVVPTTGGAPQRLVQGSSPTWGDGDAPGAGGSAGPSLASKSLRYRAGKVKVKLACDGSEECRGKLSLKKKKLKLGSRKYRIAGGASAKVTVRVKSKGKRVLERSRKHKVKVQLRTAGGEKLTETVTLRVAGRR